MKQKKIDEDKLLEELFEVKGFLNGKLYSFHRYTTSIDDAIRLIKEKKNDK